MSEYTVPFGFDDTPENVNVPEGTWDFVVHSKTNARVSSNNNPMIEWFFEPTDFELTSDDEDTRYWFVRDYTVVRGDGAGMLRKRLSRLGFDPEEEISTLLDTYDGDGSAEDVADFFDTTLVERVIGLSIRLEVAHEAAVDTNGNPRFDAEGEPMINVNVKNEYEIS